MKFIKCLKIALDMLRSSKLRSWLTVIGIVIAVSSVTTILSFSEAIKTEVNNQVGSTGADIVTISPGFSENGMQYTTVQDINFLKKLDFIEAVRAKRDISAKGVYYGEEVDLNLIGVDLKEKDKFKTLDIINGRDLKSGDSNVFLIDEKSLNETFNKKLKVGKYVEIDGENYKLIGVYKSGGMFSQNGVMIPFCNAQNIYIEDLNRRETETKNNNESSAIVQNSIYENLPSGVSEEDVYSSIDVKIKSGYDISKVEEQLKTELIKFKRTNTEQPGFYIFGKDGIMKEINKVVSIITWVLVGFAGISILVGSVGIANTMYTSVLEKTKEIGIMKAIGAKNHDIKLIFLLNSGLLGLVGGIIGVVIGLLFALLGAFLVVTFADFTSFSYLGLLSFKVIFGALVFSILIGMASGFLPSKQAAKLKPVDALRY